MEMASRSGGGRPTTELHHMSKKWKDHRTELSPERNKVWTEPPHHKHRKVPVVYYLSRNGHLEHPHFIEVSLSSSDGLYLRDVIDRLNTLRGKGMAALYSWSSKRSYKNGFVWHDLAENDFIYPAHGQEYVLKGSELVEAAGTGAGAFVSKSEEALLSMSKKSSPETGKSGGEFDFPLIRRRRNQSWSAIDLHEYKVYTGESSGVRVASDASTQTEDKRRRRRALIREAEEEIEEEEEEKGKEAYHDNESSELCREEISPPPSDSSPETLESLMKADGKLVLRPEPDDGSNPPVASKVKASSVLMQLISCGSISFRDCGPGAYGKDNPGFSLVSHYKSRILPRAEGASNQVGKDAQEATVENIGIYGRKNRAKKIVTEDKEYFSGSLIETKKDAFPALKRSNSYNADQCSRMDLTTKEKEMEGVRAKCIIGRKTKAKNESIKKHATPSSSSSSKAVADNDSDDNRSISTAATTSSTSTPSTASNNNNNNNQSTTTKN